MCSFVCSFVCLFVRSFVVLFVVVFVVLFVVLCASAPSIKCGIGSVLLPGLACSMKHAYVCAAV